jgi:hypothetical protein
MTLDEFVAEMQGQMEKFKQYWLESAAKKRHGIPWPMEMDPGEWHEQWVAYGEMTEASDE